MHVSKQTIMQSTGSEQNITFLDRGECDKACSDCWRPNASSAELQECANDVFAKCRFYRGFQCPPGDLDDASCSRICNECNDHEKGSRYYNDCMKSLWNNGCNIDKCP